MPLLLPGTLQTGVVANLRMTGGLPNSLAILALGLSNTLWGATPLPMSLAVFGAPNCSLLTSVDASAVRFTDASGVAPYAVVIPAGPALVGVVFFGQWFSTDLAANPAGIAATAGRRMTIGGYY